MTLIAIDVLLDPDAATVERAQAANARLREDYPGGAAKLVDKVKAGKAKLEGNIQVLEQLKVTLVKFDPFFEILPGTKPATAPASKPTKDEVFEDDAPVVKEP